MSARVASDLAAGMVLASVAQNVLRQPEPPRYYDLVDIFINHTPANYLRRHHAYHGMTLEEAEQYIKDHHVP